MTFNTQFFSSWMEFLKIDGDTAKTKKTPFNAENSPEPCRGVLLCFPFCKSAKSGSKHIFSCGKLEKLAVAGFRHFSEMLNY